MRLFVFLIFAGIGAYGQKTVVTGIVKKYYIGETPVSNVVISASFAGSAETDSRGVFHLKYPYLPPGKRTQLKLVYKDWVVINDKELNFNLPDLGQTDTVKLFICPAKILNEKKIEFYNISTEGIERSFVQQIKALNSNSKNYQDSIRILRGQMRELKENAWNYAEYFARAAPEEHSLIYQLAFRAYLRGDLNETIEILTSQDTNEIADEIKRSESKADSIIRYGTEMKKRNRTRWKQTIEDDMFTARSYALNAQPEDAKVYFLRAIGRDSTGFEPRYEYASFLHAMQQYSPAKYWLDEALKLPATSEDSVNLYIQLGNTLSRLFEYESSIDVYNKVEKMLDQGNFSNEFKVRHQVNLYINNGFVCLTSKKYGLSLQNFKRALSLLPLNKDSNSVETIDRRAVVFLNIGASYYHLDKNDSAFLFYQEALAHFQAIPKKYYTADMEIQIVTLYNNIAESLIGIHKLQEAKIWVGKSLTEIDNSTWIPKLTKEWRKANCYETYAKTFFEADSCIVYLLKSYTIISDIYQREPVFFIPLLVDITDQIDITYKYNNQLDGLPFYEKARQLFQKIFQDNKSRNELHYLKRLEQLGDCYLIKQDTVSALNTYSAISRVLGDSLNHRSIASNQLKIECLDNNAVIFIVKRQLDSAFICYKKAEIYANLLAKIDSSAKSLNQCRRVYGMIGEWFRISKNWKAAKPYIDKEVFLLDKLGKLFPGNFEDELNESKLKQEEILEKLGK